MLTNTHRWSHTRGNAVVPYRWQATSRAKIMRAVWRCFLGAVVFSISMASIAALNGSNRQATPCLGLRSGGEADSRACLTALR
jgi:hypothetical protein